MIVEDRLEGGVRLTTCRVRRADGSDFLLTYKRPAEQVKQVPQYVRKRKKRRARRDDAPAMF